MEGGICAPRAQQGRVPFIQIVICRTLNFTLILFSKDLGITYIRRGGIVLFILIY